MPPRPIWRAESNGAIHFVVALLVVTPQTKSSLFLRFSRFHKLSSPPVDTSPSTVRTLWKTISELFKHAESDGSLNLLLRLLVAELQAKTFQIPPAKNIKKTFLTTYSHITSCSQNPVKDYFWTFLICWIQKCPQFDPVSLGCGATSKSIQDFSIFEIPPGPFHP